MPLQIIDCEQNTPEWHAARCGIITASSMSAVLAKGEGKTRAAYMHKLIGEVFTGEAAEGYSNAAMERGKEYEHLARQNYEIRHGVTVQQIGFMLNYQDIGSVGYSPDGLIGDNGLVEFKNNAPHIIVSLILADKVPSEHIPQMQTGLWVSEREWCDICCSYTGMPPFEKRVYRDEPYIANMKAEVIRFYDEMNEKIERIKRL